MFTFLNAVYSTFTLPGRAISSLFIRNNIAKELATFAITAGLVFMLGLKTYIIVVASAIIISALTAIFACAAVVAAYSNR